MEENLSVDSWDPFKGNWLKPDDLKVVPANFVVTHVRGDKSPDDKNQIILKGQINDLKKEWSLNKTNMDVCIEKGITSPKMLVGKTLVLDKNKVYNPSLKKQVDGLYIKEIK